METLDFTDPRLLEYMRGRVMGTESGALVTPDTSLRVATAYRCVAIISCAVKTLPMESSPFIEHYRVARIQKLGKHPGDIDRSNGDASRP